ncbi:MAG: hypothetical protein ACRYG2_06810 [Janthinobacterium lividum]
MVLLIAVVLVVVGAGVGYRYVHRQVPVVVDPACPALLTNTSDAAQDFADVVTWDGRTFVRAEERPSRVLSDVAGVVGCSVGEMDNPKGWGLAPGPWPDGTATGLPSGTELRRTSDRGLVAAAPEGPILYCEADAGTLDPSC